MKPRLTQLLLILLILLSNKASGQHYWQQKVDYKMDVRLNPNSNSLDANARISYTNNSPDTLRYIWFHLWPNAYRNDRTAFSDQLLENGNTDFYFTDRENRGYINRLDFRINNQVVQLEDHPEHIDIVKLILPEPLAPGKSINISTPFHVQLPFNFSRGGHVGKTYQITQWYPKPAVYDKNGWHPMPYLDQGEFYAEFGDYEVNITVPAKFTVAATGEPQQAVEQALFIPVPKARKKPPGNSKGKAKASKPVPFNWETVPTKTLRYKQQNIHDFAWFADTSFTLQTDTVRLASGKTINLQLYFHLQDLELWEPAIGYMKDAVLMMSRWLGDYPYNYVTVVDGQQGFDGGMEYPTITILTGMRTRKELDLTIFHEIGHNWFQAALATNERKTPWMDEGMNSFYERRYEQLKYPLEKNRKKAFAVFSDPRFPELLFRTQAGLKKDQPISTPSDSLTANNYGLTAYTKTSMWMRKMEQDLGRNRFDLAMQTYYREWKFKHPDRANFEEVMERVSGRKLDSNFALLDKKGEIPPVKRRPMRFFPLYRLEKTFDYRPVYITPIVSYNTFNGLMPGLAFHNYSLPLPRFNFAVVPFYGLKSGRFNGWSRFGYQWYPDQIFSNIELSVIGARLNLKNFRDSTGRQYSLAFDKLAPALKLVFKERNPRSTYNKFLQFRHFMISEDELNFLPNDEIKTERETYNIFQTRFVIENSRVLYPWKAEILTEGHREFYKLNFTGNYFFNFRKKGGVNLRLFAGKFMYKGDRNITSSFQTQRFHLNMTGPKGFEDYTYSNPFIGRFETSGFSSQQIMIRDGAFKVRTDLLASEVGRSDDWLTAMNLTMDVPDRFNPLHVLPVKIPLKIFMDVGTHSDVWKSTSEDPRFLYDAGLQVSLINNLINFYFPLVYSRVYRDYFNSTPGNNFFQRMSFSINIQDQSIRKLTQLFSQ